MKKLLALTLAVASLLCCLVGCDNRGEKRKLVELERYSSMTIDGTTSIDVTYDYVGATYEFVINDQNVIEQIMTELFNMELKDYPEDRDIDFFYRVITVNQGSDEYRINLAYTSDGEKQYLCQSQKVCEIIEKYIEDM